MQYPDDSRKPTAIQARDIQELVDHVIHHHSILTTLIICSSREECYRELLVATSGVSDEGDTTSNGDEESQHALLKPTLHLIATTANVKLVFVPTLPQLRAYLSVYQPGQIQQDTPLHEQAGNRVPSLVIWGLVNLHRSTTEHSAQGLSRTLSAAFEVAYNCRQKLIIAEPQLLRAHEDGGSSEEVVHSPWKEQIPLLSGSARVIADQRTFAGRRIEVGDVVGKWCRFERRKVENNIL